MLEHEVRMRCGLFFNFNGTAGVWRRRCIETAGGWTHDTLTEDLDLSYRAQLAGWRFVYDGATECLAELPADIVGLKSQQRRWTRGSIQTARKLLPAIARASLPLSNKLEAFFHLTANLAYPLLIMLGLLLLPVMLGTSVASMAMVATLHVMVILLGVVPVVLFLATGQLAIGRRGINVLLDVGAAMVLGVGLSVNNAWAVYEGLGSRLGEWERTPKTGDGLRSTNVCPYRRRAPKWTYAEILLALYFMALSAFAWNEGHRHTMPFILLLAAGFGSVACGSLMASRSPGARFPPLRV
jgi:hypothetical protein